MSAPFGSYAKLAQEVFDLAAAAGHGGELITLVGLHADPEVADYFDLSTNPDRADRARARLLKAMVRLMFVYRDEHLEPPLEQSPTQPTLFLFAFRDQPLAASSHRDWAARMRCLPDLERELAAMDDTEFEQVCGQFLLAMGCTRVAVSRTNKDRGLDALGRLPTAAPGAATVPARIALRRMFVAVVVQAKRYALGTRIGAAEVRLIVGTWFILKTERANRTLPAHLDELFERLQLRHEDPTLHLVVTSARFGGDARREADGAGVVLIDGRRLAQALVAERLAVEKVSDAVWRTDGGVLTKLAACPLP